MRLAFIVPAAAAAALAAVPASASVLTYKAWYAAANGPDPATAPQTYTATDWSGVNQKILVPQFDTSLGTLTAATLSLYADINSTGSVKNNGTDAADVNTYESDLRVRVLAPSASTTGPGITTPATLSTKYLAEVLPALTVIANQTLAAGDSLAFSATGTSATSSPSDLFSSAYLGYLAYFEGTGYVTLPVFTNTRTVSDVTGGNLKTYQATAARAEAVVTYTYDAAPPPAPVPEPASAALLGAGLLALGLVRRR